MIRIKLAELLGRHKMKVTKLSEKIDVHYNTLYRLYNESSGRVDLDVLEKICDHFNCSLDEIMEYDPQYIRPSKKEKKADSAE